MIEYGNEWMGYIVVDGDSSSEKNKRFPDNTKMLLDVPVKYYTTNGVVESGYTYNIHWYYENDSEAMTLWYLVNHIRNVMGLNATINLMMPYVSNARMDRVKKDSEVATMKYFAKFINTMNFNKVYSLDVHSNVGVALIDRLVLVSPETYIREVLFDKLYCDDVWMNVICYFPDKGAMDRYGGMDVFKGRTMLYGKKVRNWDTGDIERLDILNRDGNPITANNVNGKIILMVDDIISYGGTLAYSADKLKELGAKRIYAYASHTENSVLNEEKGTLLKRLNNGTVDGIYTTNSIYKGKNSKIEVFDFNETV